MEGYFENELTWKYVVCTTQLVNQQHATGTGNFLWFNSIPNSNVYVDIPTYLAVLSLGSVAHGVRSMNLNKKLFYKVTQYWLVCAGKQCDNNITFT